MTPAQYRLLTDLLSLPTAPFREALVRDYAAARLERWGVPWFLDPAGNLVVGVESAAAYRGLLGRHSREPARLYIAHMDHPGFHGARWVAGDRLAVRWHGGAPVRHLAGAPVWLADAAGPWGMGTLHKATFGPGRRTIATAEVRVRAAGAGRRPAARHLFGGFGFRAPVWRGGQRLYTKAADDLVGVFCILEAARWLWSRAGGGGARPFLGLLSRGEEVGFVGAVAHLEQGWLARRRRPVVAVSLEASRTLPGAEIGKGPVLRLGDRRTPFDAAAMELATGLARRRLKGRHQRRIMDGGACEGTAATAWGLPTIGLSVPLGNYHNQGFEGGPDCRGPGGPAPEFVHLDDVSGQLALCRALMGQGLPWADPWGDVRARLTRNRGRYGRLLREE